MRLSESWLREWVDPQVDSSTLAEQLTMAGLEVDSVEPAAPEFNGVVVGLVQAIAPHPDAQKLRVCTVEAGTGEPLQIICGAANVAEGMRVPAALVGAKLPGGLKITKAKLCGVESYGMICSASELGLAESSDGIMPLPADAPVGKDFRDWLRLDDTLIEVDLTPDRGDCLSIVGISREIAAANDVDSTPVDIDPVPPRVDDRFAVQLLAPDACPRYACRIIRGIDPGAETPLWMVERLRRGGIRAISPVVDVTNYVLLELGQPMHAFDLDKVDGEIRVRLATDGEQLQLLNGEEAKLRPDTLVIADAGKPLALAGIMGGETSGVGAETRDILLESAFFAPEVAAGKARSYGLHTDSSHRFERGVDPGLQVLAIERATQLLVDIVGGQPGPVVNVCSDQHLPARTPLTLRAERCARILGLDLPGETVETILRRLGMEIERVDGGWRVTPPSARFDLVHEVDLIADVGRVHGYDNIPVTHFSATAATEAGIETAFDLDRARLNLVSRGYQEVITYSFVSPELQSRIEPGVEALALANPISADLSAMRLSLWPGLIQVARHNLARQQERVRIFETGLRFRPGADGLAQDPMIAGLVVGSVEPEQWGGKGQGVDFYAVKADVESILAGTGTPRVHRFVPAEHSALHPGQTAVVERDGAQAGIIGMLHPALAVELDLPADTFLFELRQDALDAAELPKFSPISRFPLIRRDIAILVDEAVAYDQVAACVREAASELLRDLILFDVYSGQKIDSGRKSLALGLILQASSQTLTDQVVDDTLARVVIRLGSEIGAKLRD